MACPYCKKLYYILTVFVAPQCGATLFFAVGTKHENNRERVSKTNVKKQTLKRHKSYF